MDMAGGGEMARALLEKGAKPNIKDLNGAARCGSVHPVGLRLWAMITLAMHVALQCAPLASRLSVLAPPLSSPLSPLHLACFQTCVCVRACVRVCVCVRVHVRGGGVCRRTESM